MQQAVLEDKSLSDKRRALVCTQLADSDKCLVDGADESLQLLHTASIMQQVLNGRFG